MLRAARFLALLPLAAGCGRDDPEPVVAAPESPEPAVLEESEAAPAPTAQLHLVPLAADRTGVVPFPAGSSVRWLDRALTRGLDEAARRARLVERGELFTVDRELEFLTLEVPASVSLDLLVLANDGEVDAVVREIAPGQLETVTITLPQRVRCVSGRLLRPDGSPLGEVSLVVNDRRETWVGADGAFSLALPASEVQLVLEVDGWPPLAAELDADASEPLEFRFAAGGTLRARVTAADGTARAGVCVELVGAGDARTDPNGLATLTGIPPEREFRVRVRTCGGAGALLLAPEEALTFAAGEPLERVYALPARGPVAGRLVDPQGRGVADVEVGLAQPRAEDPLAATYLDADHVVLRRAVTDAEGRFRFDDVEGACWLVGVAPGPWNSRLPRAGRVAPVARPVLPGAEDLELTTALRVQLAGRVVDETGAPVVRVRVVARPRDFGGTREALTQRDGSFTVKGLLPGPHDVWVEGELARGGLDPANLPIELLIELDRSR